MTREEQDELVALLQAIHAVALETKALAEEQVRIAREYKEGVGDPLKNMLYALGLIGKILAWVIGALLTIVGLHEIWVNFLDKHFKP